LYYSILAVPAVFNWGVACTQHEAATQGHAGAAQYAEFYIDTLVSKRVPLGRRELNNMLVVSFTC
jgi:hypothetical protein